MALIYAEVRTPNGSAYFVGDDIEAIKADAALMFSQCLIEKREPEQLPAITAPKIEISADLVSSGRYHSRMIGYLVSQA